MVLMAQLQTQFIIIFGIYKIWTLYFNLLMRLIQKLDVQSALRTEMLKLLVNVSLLGKAISY